MDKRLVPINREYISLGQFLKMTDFIQSGGMAKAFLDEYVVLVDGQEENRRGRKLYPGMQVEFPDAYLFEITASDEWFPCI